MAIHTPDTSLSANDARILNALFDPETLPSSVAKSKDSSAIDASLPPHPNISSSQLSLLETQQNELVRRVSATSDAELLATAVKEQDEIVSKWPSYPSAYVNRAMLRRMKLETMLNGEQNLFSLKANSNEIDDVFSDLARAIHLSLPSSSSSASVSPYQARILRTSFSHRGFLYLKAAEAEVIWKGKSKSELEELASGDFAAAARFGDEVAREMSVRTNPYAKMCGAIVKNALAEERKGEGN